MNDEAQPVMTETRADTLRRDFAGVLNGWDYTCDTPDWILAQYLVSCLQTYENAMRARAKSLPQMPTPVPSE